MYFAAAKSKIPLGSSIKNQKNGCLTNLFFIYKVRSGKISARFLILLHLYRQAPQAVSHKLSLCRKGALPVRIRRTGEYFL